MRDNLNEIRTQVLETSGNGEKLQEFLFRLPKTEDLENNEAILKAKATAAFFKGDFRELYKVSFFVKKDQRTVCEALL